VVLGTFAGDAVRKALNDHNQIASTVILGAIGEAAPETDEARRASAATIREALEETRAASRKVEEEIRADLREP
jgi:hypothetical protein